MLSGVEGSGEESGTAKVTFGSVTDCHSRIVYRKKQVGR